MRTWASVSSTKRILHGILPKRDNKKSYSSESFVRRVTNNDDGYDSAQSVEYLFDAFTDIMTWVWATARLVISRNRCLIINYSRLLVC